MPRYLTKSRFKLALECTTKLSYTSNPKYIDNKQADTFLAALAEGGFQVGELAKIYFEGGHDIEELDHEISLKKTNDLLKQESVIIYEAAFKQEDLFVRADIVCKKGGLLELIEVKAKSYGEEDGNFKNKNGTLKSEWKPYLFDIAFQYYVIKRAYPGFKVVPFLLLADKSSKASVEGLNQLFKLESEGNRVKASATSGTNSKSVGVPLLRKVDVAEIVEEISNNKHYPQPFEDSILRFANAYKNNISLPQELGAHCAQCEFKANADQMKEGYLSGFHECWKSLAAFKDEDFERPHVLSIWNSRKKDDFIGNKLYFQDQLSVEDLSPKTKKKESTEQIGLSAQDRQLIQIQKSKDKDISFYLDRENLLNEMSSCKYPLHFIDFETTAVAIPFNKGRAPYEQIAFQFSHHMIEKKGSITHAGEWINLEQGKFPNFEFVRELKTQLEKDQGSIFRYAAHENTILNKIHEQLTKSNESDKDELCNWIRTITHSSSSATDSWAGDRDMIDMLDWVKKFYYSPRTNGSNSIKYILPAILHDNNFLKEKYSVPIYGSETIKSKNFRDHTWITFNMDKQLISPYYTLPLIHEGIDNELIDTLYADEGAGIFDGGAAMTAYARMQFTEMSREESVRIQRALLRYCELDTMAMVMLWEGWQFWCK